MALELKDRIYTDCVSTGTDDAWIGETKKGYQGWEAITPNATVYYCITDDTSWEVGYGNYVNAFGGGDTADKAIKRNLLSSSTGSLLNLSGKASIFLTYPSEKAVFLNTDGNIDFPDVDTNFRHMVSRDITSGNVATSVIVVDGTEGKDDSDLAGLLNTYKKEEVDELFMPKTGGKFTGKVVIDHEEAGLSTPLEIIGDYNQSVLKFWSHGGIETTYKNFRDEDLVTKAYVDGKTDRDAVTCQQFWNNASWNTDNMVDALVSQIKVHNDRTALVLNKNGSDTTITKDWEKELAPYPSYFGIKIDEEIYFVEVEFTGKGGTNNRGYNFKILAHNLPETVENGTLVGICASYTPEPLTVADYQNFMPDGGKFTGSATFDKTITLNNNFTQVRASVEKPFHTLKTNAPLNPDGSTNTSQAFGFAIDLDSSNTLKNRFDVRNRLGNIMEVKGGPSPNGKLDFDWTYTGIINKDHHLVNKEYVDNSLHTLSSEGNKLNWVLGKSLISTQWATDTNNPETAKIYYFYKLHDHTGDEVQLNNYKTTPSTMLEIWKQGNLIVKTSLVSFEESSFSSADTQARVSGLNVTTHADELFDGTSNYGIVITNLQLK